jgi:hypothetical protein
VPDRLGDIEAAVGAVAYEEFFEVHGASAKRVQSSKFKVQGSKLTEERPQAKD